MEKHIVLKPGFGIDKAEGMAYNELVKHAIFIGVATEDGNLKDELSGSLYKYGKLTEYQQGRNTNEKRLNLYKSSGVDSKFYINNNPVFLPSVFLWELIVIEDSENRVDLMIYNPKVLLNYLGVTCDIMEGYYQCNAHIGPNNVLIERYSVSKGVYVDACKFSDVVNYIKQIGSCSYSKENVSNSTYQFFYKVEFVVAYNDSYIAVREAPVRATPKSTTNITTLKKAQTVKIVLPKEIERGYSEDWIRIYYHLGEQKAEIGWTPLNDIREFWSGAWTGNEVFERYKLKADTTLYNNDASIIRELKKDQKVRACLDHEILKFEAGGDVGVISAIAIIDGLTFGWIDKQALGEKVIESEGSGESHYNITLEDALDKQMKQKPQVQSNGKWVNASRDEVLEYLNPSNHNSGNDKYQFLDLSALAGISKTDMVNYLAGKGILAGKEDIYLDAAKKYNVSEVYLAAHSALETGNGTSTLSTGVVVKGVTVYNMYGIGAYDSNPIGGGSQYAYDKGWDTPEKAIEGGAKWISEQYINNISYQQNTLYKMRWNPASPGDHQYATDIGWAVKQTSSIKKMYDNFPNTTLIFDIPIYKH